MAKTVTNTKLTLTDEDGDELIVAQGVWSDEPCLFFQPHSSTIVIPIGEVEAFCDRLKAMAVEE